MSGGEDRFQWSWAQNFPVAPTPVCTSSTMKRTLVRLVMSRRPWKKAGEAWLSPPSDWMGSTMTAATGLWNSLIRRSISPGSASPRRRSQQQTGRAGTSGRGRGPGASRRRGYPACGWPWSGWWTSSEEAAVEGRLEGHDGYQGNRGLVVHGGADFQLGELRPRGFHAASGGCT